MSKETTIITTQEIEELLNMYKVSKSSLAMLLGWAKPTIARYLSEESTPSLHYSGILKSLYDPNQMKLLLSTNANKVTTNVYKNIKDSIEKLQLESLAQDFPGEVFIKKLNAQELGYRNNVPKKAGSYLLVPKSTIQFFPPLSSIVPNAKTELTVKFNNIDEVVPVTYVYHNSKFSSDDPQETRDEYRLYLSHLDKFVPDDIAIFIKAAEPNRYIVYKVSKDSEMNASLTDFINEHKVGKALSALVPVASLVADRIYMEELYSTDTTAEKVEELLEEPVQSSEAETDADADTSILGDKDQFDFPDLFSEGMLSSNLETFLAVAKLVKRNSRFKLAVLAAYDNKCCITNASICFQGKTNLQACHIIPKHLQGSDNPKNGLALSRDLHWCFDEGYISINDDYTVEVHEKFLDNPMLGPFHKQSIHLPIDERFHPSLDALKFHRDNIFGTFLKQPHQ